MGAPGSTSVDAQQAPARGGGAPAAAQARAPIDLTGYWVSVVTEDWLERMVTPPKGVFPGIPLNPEGRRVANTWDPATDTAEGNQCRSYGAPAIMRVPGRVHITWQDPNTLKIETDAGQQTRLLHFGDTEQMPNGDQGYQGYSVATWEFAGRALRGLTLPAGPPVGGNLKVETSHIRAGYLRKNGVPYSENATVLEYFDRHREPNGDEWFTVTTIVRDPKYLVQEFITSTHFKREPDASKWSPKPCTAS